VLVSSQILRVTLCFSQVVIQKNVAFPQKIVAYLHAAFCYREGNIPLTTCIITLKQGAEMCTTFLERGASCLRYVLEQIWYVFHRGSGPFREGSHLFKRKIEYTQSVFQERGISLRKYLMTSLYIYLKNGVMQSSFEKETSFIWKHIPSLKKTTH